MGPCINALNIANSTADDRQPIPKTHDILDGLNDSTWFSTLDMGRAYHQGYIHPDSQHLTAFVTPWGLHG